MKKKTITLLLTICFLFTGCSGNESAPLASSEAAQTEASTTEPNAEPAKEDMTALDAVGDIDVEQELFDVTINIPADYVESTTQEELDAEVAEIGCKATLNEDGSATYTMTKTQHRKMMDEISQSIRDSLTEMVASEAYPNITNVTANDNFTEFTVTTKNAEPDMAESIAAMGFYLYGGLYHIFNGTTVDNIRVDYVNADSGEVVSSTNSQDMTDTE